MPFRWWCCPAVHGRSRSGCRSGEGGRGCPRGHGRNGPSRPAVQGRAFRGPPVGDRRWKAPEPVVPWTGVRKADVWGTRCMQGPTFWPAAFPRGGDERGLPLSERVDHRPGRRWRSGRSWSCSTAVGFAAGSASEPRTDGEWFAKQGIVVVAPNYRLGLFGFMAHPELTKESGGRGSGNYGMLDQAAALRWVKDERGRFRGRSRQRDDQRRVGGLPFRERPHGLASHPRPRAQGHRRERCFLREPHPGPGREVAGRQGAGRPAARDVCGRGLAGGAPRGSPPRSCSQPS